MRSCRRGARLIWRVSRIDQEDNKSGQSHGRTNADQPRRASRWLVARHEAGCGIRARSAERRGCGENVLRAVVSLAHHGPRTPWAHLNQRAGLIRLKLADRLRSRRSVAHRRAGTRASVVFATRSFDGPANIEMEPTLFTVCAIMSPRRAAHFGRWTDGRKPRTRITRTTTDRNWLLRASGWCVSRRGPIRAKGLSRAAAR